MKKKLSIIVPSLGGGGAEKVAYHLLNNLDTSKYELSLITIYNKEGDYLKFLRKEVYHVSLKKKNIRYSIIGIYKALKEIKPDTVLVFSFEIMIIVGLILIPFFPKVKFINRQVNIVSKKKFNVFKKKLFCKSLKKFNKVIVQSKDMLDDLVLYTDIQKDKLVEINNPVNIKEIEKLGNTEYPLEYHNSDVKLISVGRIVYQKGFDLLIPIMEKFIGTNVKLYILGEGNESNKLKEMVCEHKLEKNILFLGRKVNPYNYIQNADLFILSSRFEGFPNVLLEAGSCGVYSICNNSPGGINQIIIENLNGEIVDFTKVDDVVSILKKNIQRKYNSKQIKKSIHERYSLGIILKEYEKIL